MSATTASETVRALWSAESVAVLGASPRPGSQGGQVVSLLREHGFGGRVVPVHPTADSVADRPAVRSLTEVAPVDLAVVVVSAPRVPDAVADCLAAGVRTVVVTASGFADTRRPEAVEAQDRLARQVADAGARLLGPNGIGTTNFHTGLTASFSPLLAAGRIEPGGLAVVSHSGGLGFGIAGLAAERGLAPGWVVTTGNEADVTAGEVLTALADEPGCTGLVAHLESVPDDSWLAALHDRGVPVAVLLGGRSAAGARAVVTRGTGSRESLRRFGFDVSGDVDALLDRAATFGTPVPLGDRVGVITTSGGAGILAADALDRHRLRPAALSEPTRVALARLLPEYAVVDSPLDVTATAAARPALLTDAIDLVLRDGGCDALLVCLCVLGAEAAEVLADHLVGLGPAAPPIVVSRTGPDRLAPALATRLATAGIGVHPTPGRAVAALADRLHRHRRPPPPP